MTPKTQSQGVPCEWVHYHARIRGAYVLFWVSGFCSTTVFLVQFNRPFAVTVLPFGTGICMTGPLLSKKITYKTFFSSPEPKAPRELIV